MNHFFTKKTFSHYQEINLAKICTQYVIGPEIGHNIKTNSSYIDWCQFLYTLHKQYLKYITTKTLN